MIERKMVKGGETYVGLPGRGVGSGSGKEDRGIFFYNGINNIAPRFFSVHAASYKQESVEMSVAKRSQISSRKRSLKKKMSLFVT